MIKSKAVTYFSLNLFLVFALSFFLIQGCGKKEGTTTGDKESDSKTTSKDEGISSDKPFYVEFQMTNSEKKTGIGTIKAYYWGKKCRSESSMEAAGKKMTMTAYFTGGDTVYMVSDFGGMKTGMKFSKNAFGSKDDQVADFKEKLKNMEKVGEEEILGKKCDIYKDKVKNFSISVYKETIPLKFGSADGKTVLIATKYETDAKITDDMFIPPTDVNYTNTGDMMKALKDTKNMDEKMKNLEQKTKEMEDVLKKYKK
jgi:hypothetical protein